MHISLTQFWLLIGKPFFNIANTLVYCGFILLTYFHITGNLRKFKPTLFLAINAFYWVFVPVWGQNFLWLTGSCNYLWTTTIILFFLVPFRKKHDSPEYKLNILLSLLFFIVGILAGWSNENSGAAVFCLLIAYFVMKLIRKEKINLFEITGFIGFLIGFALLIAAPGNYIRAAAVKEFLGDVRHYNDPFMIMMLKRFVDITFIFFRNHGFTVMAFAALFAFDLHYNKKHRLNLFSYFYALAALVSTYSMILSPEFPDRAFFIVIVFAGITLGNVLMQFGMPIIIKQNRYLVIGLLLLGFSLSVLQAGKNIIGIYLKWQTRIEYILTEKEKGNLDLEVKAPIPAGERHTGLYELPDILYEKNDSRNVSIAKYFGIKSIKQKFDGGKLWKPVW